MTVTTTTHLNFRGQAREALDLYASIFGGDVLAVTYGDAKVDTDSAVPDQLMWGGLDAPNGLRLMAFDVPPGRPFSRGEDSVFVAVRTPLGQAAWGSPLYGMLDDRFGITWILEATPAQS